MIEFRQKVEQLKVCEETIYQIYPEYSINYKLLELKVHFKHSNIVIALNKTFYIAFVYFNTYILFV